MMRLLPTRSLAVKRYRLLLIIARLQLRRWRRNAIDMMMGNQLGRRPEQKQQHWIMEEAVDGAEDPESDEKVEEVLDDELKGRKVENQEDQNARRYAVENEWNRVFQSQTESPLAVADRC